MARALLVAACAALAALAVPAAAAACEPVACATAYFAPGEGDAWPVGTWPVYRPAGSLNEPPDLTTFELLDPSGNRVPVRFAEDALFPRFFVIEPASIVTGTYRARFPTGDCAPGPIREVSFERIADEVGAPPLGVVEAGPVTREPHVVPSAAGMCVETIAAGVVRLEVSVPPRIAPLLGLASFELLVDDVPWARTLYGDALDQPASESRGGRLVSEVFTACEEGIGVVDIGLAPGRHRGELRMTVPDADPSALFAPAEFEFDIGCSDENTGGTGGAGGTGGGAGQGGTGDVIADPGLDGSGADSAGCACNTSGSAESWVGLLSLGWLVRRRRD